MKKPILFFILLPLFSCNENRLSKEQQEAFTFSVEIDTVQIDFKDSFYFMEFRLGTSTVSPDKKILYNLNAFAPNLEVIDLDKLELIKVEPMDREGSKGIGPLALTPKIAVDGKLLLMGVKDIRVFDPTRTQMDIVKMGAENLSGDVLETSERFGYAGAFSGDGSHYYALYEEEAGMLQGEIKGLAIVNLVNKQVKKIPIPELNRISEFIIKGLEFDIEYGEKTFLGNFGDLIIASTTAFNEAFVYDVQQDALVHKQFHSLITADAKKGEFDRVFGTEGEWKALSRERSKEVDFGKFLYDDQNEKFWRFSYEMDRMIGDSIVHKTVLTIFDSDLNQLHEQQVSFDYSFYQSFFKDGTLYSYINLNDEMAFVRVKPTYIL